MQKPSKIFAKLTFAFVTGTLCVGLGSCLSLLGADQGTVTITRAVLPQRVGGQGCQNALAADIANGILDLQAGSGYTAGLVLRTNLPATFNTQDLTRDQQRSPNYVDYGKVDSNIVSINRAYVYIEDGEASQAPFSLLNPTAPQNDEEVIVGLPSADVPRVSNASGVVFNQQTNLGAESTIFVPAITPQEAVVLESGAIGSQLVNPGDQKLVIARITLEGVTSGAGYVQSNQYSLPITLCRGCLVGGVNCANNQVLVGQNCALLGQDQPAECQDVN